RDRHNDLRARRAGNSQSKDRRPNVGVPRPGCERHAREEALPAGAGQEEMSDGGATRSRTPSDVGKAAWLFLAPALLLIFIFFFLPVLASLVLSVTDFDIYAIASPATTRFVGLA